MVLGGKPFSVSILTSVCSFVNGGRLKDEEPSYFKPIKYKVYIIKVYEYRKDFSLEFDSS